MRFSRYVPTVQLSRSLKEKFLNTGQGGSAVAKTAHCTCRVAPTRAGSGGTGVGMLALRPTMVVVACTSGGMIWQRPQPNGGTTRFKPRDANEAPGSAPLSVKA